MSTATAETVTIAQHNATIAATTTVADRVAAAAAAGYVHRPETSSPRETALYALHQLSDYLTVYITHEDDSTAVFTFHNHEDRTDFEVYVSTDGRVLSSSTWEDEDGTAGRFVDHGTVDELPEECSDLADRLAAYRTRMFPDA